MDSVITVILICAGFSLLLNLFLRRLQVESMIGYILTGVMVGFTFDLQHSDSLDAIAEFGIVFLMFTVGVEFSPEKLRLMKKEVFLLGPLQMLATASIFFAIGHWLLGINPAVNLIVCLALSLSSTAIVLNLLTRSRKISRRYGRDSVGILLFQDMAVIPILLMVSIFARSNESVPLLLLDVVIGGAVAFVLLFFGARILTPYVMQHIIGTRSNELFVGAILLFVVGASQLAYSLGFSHSLGAFLGGMVIAETQYKHQVVADMTPFRDLLLGVFFITVGIQVDPVFMLANLPIILGLMICLLVLKSLTLFIILRFFNGTRTSLKTALLLAQCGEFSFVVFESAQANDLFMDPLRGQLLVMTVVMTMMLTPFLFRHLDAIVSAVAREPEDRSGHAVDNLAVDANKQQVVICGFGIFGQRVAARLDAAAVSFIAIEHDGRSFRQSRDKGAPVLFGNAASRQLLERIGIDQARAVIIAMSNEARILLVSRTIRAIAPDVPIMVCASNTQLADELSEIGVFEPIDSADQAAAALVDQLLTLAPPQ